MHFWSGDSFWVAATCANHQMTPHIDAPAHRSWPPLARMAFAGADLGPLKARLLDRVDAG